MGRPLPGVEAAIVRRDDDGTAVVATARSTDRRPGVEGELALRPGWPSMFRGYLGRRRSATARCFAGGWYLTGDLARRDADGYFWFVGRADDVIKSAGHLIGPFEVESALMEHPAVAEAGVIGKPDPVAGEVVKAFVALQARASSRATSCAASCSASPARGSAPAVAPQGDRVRPSTCRKTRSGKIMRRLLKARELGLPEGDISTLENAP